MEREGEGGAVSTGRLRGRKNVVGRKDGKQTGGTMQQYGATVRYDGMVQQYGATVRYDSTMRQYGATIWCDSMVRQYTTVWYDNTVRKYGATVRYDSMVRQYGATVWCDSMVQQYGAQYGTAVTRICIMSGGLQCQKIEYRSCARLADAQLLRGVSL